MSVFLTLTDAASRIARSEVGREGLRTLIPGGELGEEDENNPDTGDGTKRFFKKAAGMLWDAGVFLFENFGIGRALQGLSSLVGLFSNAASFIWNFNWNISEEQIEADTKIALIQLAGQAGGLVGQAMGWATCGALPGMVMLSFNEVLGMKILKDVGEEAFDELAGVFQSLVTMSVTNFGRIAFLKLYASTRRLAYRIKGDKVPDFSKKKPWSFATKWEDYLDNLSNRWFAEFLEEFREEFAEACTEALYVVANSVEEHLAERLEVESRLPSNRERIVEIDLNRGTAG